MAGRTAVLAVKVIADNRQAVRGLNETGAAADHAGGKLGKLRLPAAAALGGIAALAKGSLDAASDLQQSTGAVQSVYGKFAGSIIKNAKAAASAVGLSQSAYQTQAVLLGSQLKNLGTPLDQVAGKTSGLIKRASDLAATFGGSTADAVEAIGSLMRGERDPIERYGVSINDAAVKAYILAHKLPAATDAQMKNAKATATMALLYKQTSAASGQFARETTSVAGAQEIANAKWENAKAALGTKLLPVVAKFKSLLASAAGFVQRNSSVIFTLAGIVAGAAVAVLSINTAVKAFTATQRAFAAVQTLVNFVMNANPAVRIALAIAALAAAVVIAYKRSETFRAVVQAAFGAVKAVIGSVVTFVTETVPDAFMAIYRGIKHVWDLVVGFIRTWGPRAAFVLAPFIAIPVLIITKFDRIKGWFANLWTSVIGRARTFVTDMVHAITGIPSRIAGVAGRLLTAGRNIMSALFRGISEGIQGVGGFVSDVAHTVVNGIIKGLNAALNLPWRIKIHIPIKFAPDINIGPYTIVPSIPLWAAAAEPVRGLYGPARTAGGEPARAVGDLVPGFSLWSAGAEAATWPAQLAVAAAGRGSTYVDRRTFRVTFSGLVTDPEAVASQLRELAHRSDERNGVTRGRR